MAEHLFTYGTLRRGAPMHRLLEGRVRCLGPAHAPGRLLDLGAFPALVSPATDLDRVRGELFAVEWTQSAVLLDALDRYEGASFARESARVEGPEGVVLAWLYRWLGDPRGRALVPGGDYLAAPRVPVSSPAPRGDRR